MSEWLVLSSIVYLQSLDQGLKGGPEKNGGGY